MKRKKFKSKYYDLFSEDLIELKNKMIEKHNEYVNAKENFRAFYIPFVAKLKKDKK